MISKTMICIPCLVYLLYIAIPDVLLMTISGLFFCLMCLRLSVILALYSLLLPLWSWVRSSDTPCEHIPRLLLDTATAGTVMQVGLQARRNGCVCKICADNDERARIRAYMGIHASSCSCRAQQHLFCMLIISGTVFRRCFTTLHHTCVCIWPSRYC